MLETTACLKMSVIKATVFIKIIMWQLNILQSVSGLGSGFHARTRVVVNLELS